jgi:multiple sugar transport system substrate-binding protein
VTLRTTIGAALAALVLVAAGCGGDDEEEAAQVEAGEVSGTVKLRGWGNPVEKGLLQQVIDAFEQEFPNIKVDYQVIEGDYLAAMTASFSARKPPDVFYVDSSVAPDWIDQQLLEPLDSYIEENDFDTEPFHDSLVDTFRGPDDQLYGLPKDWSSLATLTNTELVEDAGIEVPTTWEELRSAAEEVEVASGGAPICLDDDWARWMPWVFQGGGSFLNEDKTEVTVNSDETKEAFEFWTGLYEDGLVATPEKLGVGWCGEAIGKKKSAIVFEGNWVVPFLDETYPDIKYAIHPLVQGEEEANMAYTVSYSMAADSKNKDAAWVLLSYLVGQQGMEVWTSKGLALPSREDVEPVEGREAFVDDADVAHGWQLAPKFTQVYDTANNELTNVVLGKKPIDEMLTKVEQTAQNAIED